MAGFRFKLMKLFLKALDKVQVFKRPFFLTIGPTSYKIKGVEMRGVMEAIRAGDILLRRWDTYLTSKMVPGFWSHAGVYVGKGMVIHATGKGVVEEDILDFLRADEIAILRVPKGIRAKAAKVIPAEAHKLKGRAYDYEFDFDDAGKLSCTEVVKICLEPLSIGIPTSEKGLYKGRIRPDDLLCSGLEVIFSTKEMPNNEDEG